MTPINVQRGDRWMIYQRLQELKIPCECFNDGSLRVSIDNPLAIVLVRSTILSFVLPRQDLIHWLERCWDIKHSRLSE